MSPRYRVTLTAHERRELDAVTKRGKTQARQVIHARALVLCDAGECGPAWTVADTAEALGISNRSIEHLKQRFVEDGLDAALERQLREKPPRDVTFDGAFEARLSALACSEAQEGHRRWTVRLLADKVVALNCVASVSHMTVQRALKKRTAASSQQVLEHPSGRERGVRSQYGGRAGGVAPAVRS